MADDYGYEGNQAGGYSPGVSENATSPPKKLRTNQSLIPVTIKQILEAPQGIPDDAFRIDNREVNQLTLVGVIRSVSENPTNFNYEVEDGTGLIEVREWASKDDSDYAANKRSNRREGVYVRVVGLLKSFHGNKHIMAFNIRPISDYNEVTHHFLEAIYAHLYNTKGPVTAGGTVTKSPSKPSNLGGNQGGQGSRQQQQRGQQQRGQQQQQQQQQNEESLAENILRLLHQNTSDAGVSITDIARTFEDIATLDDVKQAIAHLCNEAHIYATIDEEHFAVTGS